MIDHCFSLFLCTVRLSKKLKVSERQWNYNALGKSELMSLDKAGEVTSGLLLPSSSSQFPGENEWLVEL
jgi:hypothetical protein